MANEKKKTGKKQVEIKDLRKRQQKAEVADDQAEKVKGGDGSGTGGGSLGAGAFRMPK